MFKFKKQWQCDFKEHQIETESWWDIFMRTGESLMIDGSVVAEHRGWFGVHQELYSQIVVDGKAHKIKAKFGSVYEGSELGCQIFVDGKLVGGDIKDEEVDTNERLKSILQKWSYGYSILLGIIGVIFYVGFKFSPLSITVKTILLFSFWIIILAELLLSIYVAKKYSVHYEIYSRTRLLFRYVNVNKHKRRYRLKLIALCGFFLVPLLFYLA